MDGSQIDSGGSSDLNNRGYSSSLIAHTKRAWQPYSDAQISDQDAEEIIRNVLELFDYLQWLQAKNPITSGPNISQALVSF